MDSAPSRDQRELLRRQSIQRQIAQLQAQLFDPDPPPSPCAHPSVHVSSLEDTKRKLQAVAVLAPASPEHKKRRVTPVALPHKAGGSGTTDEHRNFAKSNAADCVVSPSLIPSQPGPSSVLSKLSALSKRVSSSVELDAPMRTSSFADKASGAPPRDDRLTLIEQLEPGPYKHKPPFDDPLFEHLEPHSGIRLASRKLPHEDLQAYMSGRYYVSPSTLYSVVRAHPGPGAGARGQVFDVPVVGDWVTIAVVAERSPVRISRAPVAVGPGEARDADDTPAATPSVPSTTRNSKPGNKDPPPRAGRKYVNLTLIDFGAGGKKGTARGDAALSLLLFKSDAYDTVSRGDGLLPEKIYKGGSRGAYESMAKLREGSVIALLNPRVLKPLQKPGAPSMLALTPESADSVAVIGTARDLGMCGVVKRDGKPCGSWCDKRVSEVCEYHVQHAIERRRSSRPEFSVGTSGMSMGANSQKRKAAYDPQRKWGLAPPDGRGSAQSSSEVANGVTYVVAGHIVASGKRDLFVNESVGREAQARAARQVSSRDTDVALKRLLSRDKEGMEAVQAARSFVRKKKAVTGQVAGGKSVPKLGEDELELSRKRKEEEDNGDGMSESESGIDDDDDSEEEREETRTTTRNAYSAQVIKELGFDPTVRSSSSRAGRRRKENDDPQNAYYSELAELASCREVDKIRLGPRPGGHLRSVVSAPPKAKEREREVVAPGKPAMVVLDESSDDELTVEPPAH